MKKAIVSVLLGNYDDLKPAPKFYGWDSILFTDNDYIYNLGWDIRKVKSKKPLVDSRYYKWMTHITLKEYDLICYIDGSMRLKLEPPSSDLWFRHPSRTNVHIEGQQILKYYPDLEKIIDTQLNMYARDGFKDDFGLFQNGFFVRRHEKPTNELCSTIFGIVSKFCHRDQLAMPYALYKTGYKMKEVRPAGFCYRYVEIKQHL